MWHFFEQYFGTELTMHLWNSLLVFVAVMASGFIVKHLLNTIVRKLVAKTKTDLDDKIFDIIVPRVKWITIIIALYLSLEEIAKSVREFDKTGQQLVKYSEGIVYICVVFFFSFLLIKLIDVMLMHTMEQHARRTSAVVNEALFPILNRLIMILILFIAGVTILGHFGVNISSLLVFLGGSSVAIALAAQETLANMIAGFVIMIDRPFRLGDRVKLPTGEIGDVYEIGLRSTKILDSDNNLIVNPNSELTKARVVNYSYPAHEIRVLVEMNVAYGTPFNAAREIMVRYAQACSDILKEPAPTVYFVDANSSSCKL
ncbi:MAG TPA: mechanosensitive ion channel family protein, partial [Bacteroidota bacterium]|nr:mechanosensitive ion channel family protein [Bacteroidota bacterium]